MGVYRQPPYPAQLFGAVAVLFSQVAASPPPLPAYSQQNVASAYRAPDSYRLQSVFPQQLFPQVVDPVPLKATDPQILALAATRPIPPYPYQVESEFPFPLFPQVVSPLPLKSTDPQVLATAAYRASLPNPTQGPLFNGGVFPQVTDAPPLAGPSQQLAPISKPYPQPQALAVPLDALFPPAAPSAFPFQAPYQPPSYSRGLGNGQPPSAFPAQLFPPVVTPDSPPLALYSPQLNAAAAYRAPVSPAAGLPPTAALIPANPDSPAPAIYSPQINAQAAYRAPLSPAAGPLPAAALIPPIPDVAPLALPIQQPAATYRPIYSPPPVAPATAVLFPVTPDTAPLTLPVQQNAILAFRLVDYPRQTTVPYSPAFDFIPIPPPAQPDAQPVNDSQKRKKPYSSIWGKQDQAERAYAAEQAKALQAPEPDILDPETEIAQPLQKPAAPIESRPVISPVNGEAYLAQLRAQDIDDDDALSTLLEFLL